MKSCILVGISFIACAGALSAESATYETAMKYRYFAEEGVYLREVSNKAANDMVAKGVASDDPLIKELTIGAMGGIAGHVANKTQGPFGELPKRAFAEVPGLKNLLITEWREWHGKTGHNADAAFERIQARLEAAPRDFEGQLMPMEISELRESLKDESTAWVMIPQILCVYWPTDTEVLALLWEFLHNDLSPHTPQRVLRLMFRGAFATPEVDEYRIDTLRLALSEIDETMSANVAFAVAGLGISKPANALPLVIRAGRQYQHARLHALVVVADYPDDVLAEHTNAIAKLLAESDISRPMGAEVEAHRRLEKIVGTR